MVPLALASLVFRYRRADGTEREQLRWLIFAGVIVGLGILSNVFIGRLVSNPNIATDISNAVVSVAATSIPIAIGIAILKYRLYDIDLVLNKTVVYGALAAFITSSTSRSSSASVRSSVEAASRTSRSRSSRPRSSPWRSSPSANACSGSRTGWSTASARPRTRCSPSSPSAWPAPTRTRTCCPGWHGSWPRGPARRGPTCGCGPTAGSTWTRRGPSTRTARRPVDVAHLADGVTPVRHQGELLGALTIEKKPGEAVTPTEQKLIDDLAAQAGLVLRNVGLTEQLLARLEELKASRQRLVTAQDEERRKLERNIHDGAQQQLVALAVQLKLARTMLDRDPTKTGEILDGLQRRAGDALEDLRDLARGIYPPLLADKGLPTALEAQARKAAVPTTVDGRGVARYAQDVEAAVYFSCLEAMNNVAKYADASTASLALTQTDGHLTFTVTDDGGGSTPRQRATAPGCRGSPTGSTRSGGRSRSPAEPARERRSPAPSRRPRADET